MDKFLFRAFGGDGSGDGSEYGGGVGGGMHGMVRKEQNQPRRLVCHPSPDPLAACPRLTDRLVPTAARHHATARHRWSLAPEAASARGRNLL